MVMSCYCAGVEQCYSWLSSSKTLPFLEATLRRVSISLSLSLSHTRVHTVKRGRTKHLHQGTHMQHYSPCWALPLGWGREREGKKTEQRKEESDEEGKMGRREKV